MVGTDPDMSNNRHIAVYEAMNEPSSSASFPIVMEAMFLIRGLRLLRLACASSTDNDIRSPTSRS